MLMRYSVHTYPSVRQPRLLERLIMAASKFLTQATRFLTRRKFCRISSTFSRCFVYERFRNIFWGHFWNEDRTGYTCGMGSWGSVLQGKNLAKKGLAEIRWLAIITGWCREANAAGSPRRRGRARKHDGEHENAREHALRRRAHYYVFSNFYSNFWLILANFERPILGCIDAKFCK